tara:strand:+ start:155 stop:499 length:345 start_codon:yes stop_codon:yes gene_type:complete
MKNLITLILLLFTSISFSQEMTVLYMNSSWNSRNGYTDVDKLKRAKILKVNFEDQPLSIRNAIRSVPAIIVLKDGRPVATWQADLSMKLKVRWEDVQDVIDGTVVPRTRRASTN